MFTPATTLDDSPITIGGWSPKNYEGRFSGPTSIHEALVRSRNGARAS
jgi:penicillin-binding protein 1A